ncbi:unnamed protein product [Discula destructiva]
MREHLQLRRRLTLQQQPLLAVGSTFDFGRAFGGLLSAYYSSLSLLLLGWGNRASSGVAPLAAVRALAVQGAPLAVAFAARVIPLLLSMGALVEAGVGVVVVLSYAVWCFIFGVTTMSVAFV